MHRPLSLLILLLIAGTGCAHYEYDILEPPQARQHIGTDRETVVQMPPMRYRFLAYKNHLLVEIFDDSKEPISLVGGKSVVFDPTGESHPIPGITIFPGALVRLMLPTVTPVSIPPGMLSGSNYYGNNWNDPSLSGPAPMDHDPTTDSAAGDDNRYWDWTGETNVRLVLTYRAEDKGPFTQTFLIHRVKM
jgi:hypothetical protein